jgi:hypothetical protein
VTSAENNFGLNKSSNQEKAKQREIYWNNENKKKITGNTKTWHFYKHLLSISKWQYLFNNSSINTIRFPPVLSNSDIEYCNLNRSQLFCVTQFSTKCCQIIDIGDYSIIA